MAFWHLNNKQQAARKEGEGGEERLLFSPGILCSQRMFAVWHYCFCKMRLTNHGNDENILSQEWHNWLQIYGVRQKHRIAERQNPTIECLLDFSHFLFVCCCCVVVLLTAFVH